MKTAVLAEPVLVGRDKELAELEHLLEAAAEGKGTTAFVSGEAGAGKTRLTREFLKAAEKKGITVLSGWCLSDAAIPYFPFVGAFDSYFASYEEESVGGQAFGFPAQLTKTGTAGIEGFGITSWLTGLRFSEKQGKPELLSPQVWKDQVFVAVGKTLHSISVQSPTVLFIEDIHWADSASLALLHYISRIIGSERILVLATFRSEELTTDAEGHQHPLAEMMRLMRREDLFTEIKLQNLKQADVSKIVENMMGGSVQLELIEKLADESRGNALFVVESVRMLAERKSLVQEDNQWRLGVYELGIPSKIKDIILRRLGTLRFDQRRVLDAASVIGEKFDVELLGAVLGQDSLEVLETLNFIARSTSLVSVEGNFYRFDHAKSREALYDEIPLPLKRGYHTRVAERMESTNKNGKLPLSDLAFHYAQADNKEKALKFAMAAGQDELARFSNAEASRHFKYVLDKTPESSERLNERLIALEGLGDALYAMSLLEEAKKAFEQLIQNADSGSEKLRALKKAMLCTYWLGNIQGALEVAGKAEEYAQSDRLEYARLRLHRGFITGRAGKNDEAIQDMEQALQVFEDEISLPDVAEALVELTFIYRSKGRVVDAFSAGLRSILLYEELEDLRGQGLAYSRLAGPFMDLGLVQEAMDNLATAIKIEEKVGDYNLLALHYWAVGQACEIARDFKRAVAQNLKGLEYAGKTEGYYVQCLCYAAVVQEYAKLGKIERAEEVDNKLAKLLDEVPSLRKNRNVIGSRAVGLSRLQIARGQWKEAKETLEDLLRDKYTQTPSQEASIREGLGRLMTAQGKTEESKAYLEEAKIIRQKILGELEHAKLQTDLMAPREIGIGEEFNVRLDLVNIINTPISLLRVDELIPQEFEVTMLPSNFTLQNVSVEMNRKELKPYSVEPLKLKMKATKPGTFNLPPKVVYMGDSGETKTLKLKPATITVHPTLHMKIEEKLITVPILPGRVTTGFTDLDTLLLGGIPEGYAVVLTSPSIDERELLIKRFLAVGAEAGETTFFITAEPNNGKSLAEKYPSNFYLFVFNPQADTTIQSSPNIFKLRGIENLTEIDITLTKALRTLNPENTSRKRACIEIVSDVLLQHHAIITRKWLSGILPTLKSKGFTTLAVLNPEMHSQEEAQAIIGLFEGEIRVSEKETTHGTQKILRIRKLYNQKYLENELVLNKEDLKS